MSQDTDRRIGLIEDAFEAFNERGAEGLVDFVHPEVEARVASPLLNTGTWHGFEGFAEMTAGWLDVWGEMNYELRDVEVIDERSVLVTAHQEGTGLQSGVPVALDVVYLLEFEGEQVIRFQVHASRDSALAAL